jgi:hypothetical protein
VEDIVTVDENGASHHGFRPEFGAFPGDLNSSALADET